MNSENAALCFSNLGHQRRLEIIRLLIKAAPDGLTMGQIANNTKIPDSTLTHHITLLEQSGLISRQQENQSLICTVNIKLIKELAKYLLDECCVNSKNKC
jgi:ArsR family transcriptional regulator, arsenate/arsenite/antimonite-responsive transcriptional repressor